MGQLPIDREPRHEWDGQCQRILSEPLAAYVLGVTRSSVVLVHEANACNPRKPFIGRPISPSRWFYIERKRLHSAVFRAPPCPPVEPGDRHRIILCHLSEIGCFWQSLGGLLSVPPVFCQTGWAC